MNGLIKEKIEQAVKILNEKQVDMWMTFIRESSVTGDPMIDMIVGMNATWESAFIICRDGSTHAIVGSLEVENVNRVGAYRNVTGYVKSVKEPLLEILNKKNPDKIALNYSTNNSLADGLSYGLFLNLNKYMEGTGFASRFVSSEDIISSLRGRKSAKELELMTTAVKEAEKIIDEVTRFIKPGKTEKDVADFVIGLTKERGFGLAWEEDHCPAVFTGPEAGSAHSGPTNNVIEKGHLINIDFGVNYKGYCSDLQRTWYILKDDETEAPAEVKKGFEVLRDSIQHAADKIKPGVTGCEVDDAARNHITGNGYAEYPHGLGHQVGRVAHDGGGGLFPRWERYGNLPYLPIEEGQVFTIEPRLTVEGHGTCTMEEEIFVTKDGCRYISNPQRELWLIR